MSSAYDRTSARSIPKLNILSYCLTCRLGLCQPHWYLIWVPGDQPVLSLVPLLLIIGRPFNLLPASFWSRISKIGAHYPIDKSEIMIIIVVAIVIVVIVMIHQHEIQVTNRGKTFRLSRAGIEASLENVAPERVTKYGVEIHGHEYSVLQVLAAATRTAKIEWSTVNAYRILQKLGFEIRAHG